MADAVDSKSAGETRVGSTPTFGTIKIMMKKKHILFACIHNSGRSKIAEAFFNYYVNKLNKKNILSCSSAGTYPKKNVNTNVQKVMKEVGINIIGKPQIINNDTLSKTDIVFTMGCDIDSDKCPNILDKKTVDWNLADPSEKNLEEVRKIRDQIDDKVKNLIQKLLTEKRIN